MKTGKRILATILVVLMLICSAPLSGFVETDWSAFSKAVKSVGESFGSEAEAANPFSTGQCTWYAYKRWTELLGYEPAVISGNAGGWYDNCVSKGFSRGSTPKVGAIVCWNNGVGTDAGHVAIVESVNNGSITVSEYNWNVSLGYGTRTISLSSINCSSSSKPNRYLKGYIYLPGNTFKFTYSIDASIPNGSTIDKTKTPKSKVGGWCFGSGGAEADVYYSVDSAADYICGKCDRQDVKNVYENVPLNCGFTAEIPIENLSDGQHRISLWCKSGSNVEEMIVSNITVTSSYSDPIINGVYWGNNGGNSHCRPVVEIANPETVDGVLFPMWSHNGDGVQNNLNWYETVFNGGSSWFNDISYSNFTYQYIDWKTAHVTAINQALWALSGR